MKVSLRDGSSPLDVHRPQGGRETGQCADIVRRLSSYSCIIRVVLSSEIVPVAPHRVSAVFPTARIKGPIPQRAMRPAVCIFSHLGLKRPDRLMYKCWDSTLSIPISKRIYTSCSMDSSDDKFRDIEVAHAEQLPTLDSNGHELGTRANPAAMADKQGVSVAEAVMDRITDDAIMEVSRSSLKLWSRTGLRLAGIMFVMGINQAAYGVDWAVIGNINAYDTWHNYFGFGNTGPILATINALMTIGAVVGAPFLVLSDVWGRRSVNILGNAICIVASIMQSQAPNLACFMVGRFLLGFGTSLCTSAQYMAEISPVHLRGRFVGIFGACFQIGSVLMGGVMVGFSRFDTSNWQWRAPLLIAALGPCIVCSTIYWLCPESPRYLVMKGRYDEARVVIAKTMTSNNDVNAPVVGLVFRQIEESLESGSQGTKTLRAAWDFRVFFTKRVGYRTMIIVVYSLFQSWNGGGIISMYLTPALETVGITASLSQTGISLGTTATYFVFTALGAYLIDKMRRRTLIFAGLISCVFCQTAVTITSWQYQVTESKATASLTVFWVFLFQSLSASFIATMHNLYPIEIMALPIRAKGMAFYSLVQSAAGVVQNYGISIGIGIVGYKIWTVYIVYNTLQLIVAYFIFPETSGLSLEDIDYIFETPGEKPVKLSLAMEKARKGLAREQQERQETSA